MTWCDKVKSPLRAITITLALTAVLAGIAANPAFAEERGRGAQNSERHGDRDHRRDERGRHDERYWREYQRSHRDWDRRGVYAPPPVVYSGPQSPGISIFLPLDFN
jgi:Ni/Co efflux regulator RcnB